MSTADKNTRSDRPTGKHRKVSFDGWFLEALMDGRKRLRLPVFPLPFRIGRRHGLALTLPWETISKEHAEIFERNGELVLLDLQTTNGTFVNGRRIDRTALYEGDIVHFARARFRLGRRAEASASNTEDRTEEERTTVVFGGLTQDFIEGTEPLAELLRDGLVEPMFQPIVSLPDASIAGYEVLGRGKHPQLPTAPADLFRIAAGVGVQADLSALFRRRTLELIGHRRDFPRLFFNMHPAELDRDDLSGTLSDLRRRAPALSLAVQLRGSAQNDARTMAELRATLYSLGISLAYDDFRITQGRLVEMAELPPDYLKFDRRFIHGIESTGSSDRRLLMSFVASARDLMVQTVAQGIETEGEAEVCARIGFTHAQGNYFGEPLNVAQV